MNNKLAKPPPQPAAIILCGGHSKRMRRSKASLPFGPETLLERIIRLVSLSARPIVIVAAPSQILPKLDPSIILVRDPFPDLGPLPALFTGLAALPAEIELAYAAATDAPFLHSSWIPALANLIGPADIAIPYVKAFHHPLAALYRRDTVLPLLDRLLSQGHLRLLSLLNHLPTRLLTPEDLLPIDPTLQTLRNLNTPQDYLQALQDAGFPPPQPDPTPTE